MVIVIIRHYKRAGEDPVHFPGFQARTHVEQKNQNQRHDHSLGLAHNSSSIKIGRGACRSLLDAPRSRCKRKVRWTIVIIINSTISNLNDYNFLNTTQYTFDPIRLLIHCNGAVISLQTADQWRTGWRSSLLGYCSKCIK